jgi:hypothetical protein
VKNEPPEENEVKKWNLGSFFPPNISTEQKSPNEAPKSNESVTAVKNNHGEDGELPSDEDESNDDSDEIQRTPPSEHNFNHLNENSNNSSIPDKFSDHEQSMPPPANRNDKREIPNKSNELKNALLEMEKTFMLPIQPLSSLSDSDGKIEIPTGGSPMKKKKSTKRTKPPVSVPGDSSSDEDNSQYPPSSKSRRRKSLDNTKIRGRPPKKSSSSNSLPASYDQQPISDSACNGAKKLPTPQHKSPRGSLKDAVIGKKTKNVLSRETISSSDDSNKSDEEMEIRSPSKKAHQKSVTPRRPELSSKKQPAPTRSSSSASSSSSSSQSDSDHSTKKTFVSHSKPKIQSPVPISQSRPSSSLQHHLPPAASSVHRNDSSDQSDSDDSRHDVPKGKVKEAKNQSGDKNKHILLGKLFAPRPVSNSEGLGKGGKNGGKKPIGQVVVVTEETPKLSNDINTNCHVQNHHPKYSTTSPTSAFSNNISSASTLALNPSVMVRIDLSRLDLRSLGIPLEKLKAAGLLKSPKVPEQASNQRPKSSDKKRRRSMAHDDEEELYTSSKKHKQVDRLSVSSSTSNSSSSSTSSSDATNSRVSFPPMDRLNNNNNIDHKPPTSYTPSPNSDSKMTSKVKRESQHVSPMKSESKPKVKQEKTEPDDSSQSRNRMPNSSSQQFHKDVKKLKKMKTSHDDNLSTSTTQVALVAPTNHDRLGMVNGDTPVAIVAPSTIIKPVYVSYFERNNDAEQPEMR